MKIFLYLTFIHFSWAQYKKAGLLYGIHPTYKFTYDDISTTRYADQPILKGAAQKAAYDFVKVALTKVVTNQKLALPYLPEIIFVGLDRPMILKKIVKTTNATTTTTTSATTGSSTPVTEGCSANPNLDVNEFIVSASGFVTRPCHAVDSSQAGFATWPLFVQVNFELKSSVTGAIMKSIISQFKTELGSMMQLESPSSQAFPSSQASSSSQESLSILSTMFSVKSFFLISSFTLLCHQVLSCAPVKNDDEQLDDEQDSFSKLDLLYGLHPRAEFTYTDEDDTEIPGVTQALSQSAAMEAALSYANVTIGKVLGDNNLTAQVDVIFTNLYDAPMPLRVGKEMCTPPPPSEDKTKIVSNTSQIIQGPCPEASTEDWPPYVIIKLRFTKRIAEKTLTGFMTALKLSFFETKMERVESLISELPYN